MLALYEIKKKNEKLTFTMFLCCAGCIKLSKSNVYLVNQDRQVKQTESLIENSSSLTAGMRISWFSYSCVFCFNKNMKRIVYIHVHWTITSTFLHIIQVHVYSSSIYLILFHFLHEKIQL